MDAYHYGCVPGLAAPERPHIYTSVYLEEVGTAAVHAVVTIASERAPDAANVGGPVQSETQYLILEQAAHRGKLFSEFAPKAAWCCLPPWQKTCAITDLTAITCLHSVPEGGPHA